MQNNTNSVLIQPSQQLSSSPIDSSHLLSHSQNNTSTLPRSQGLTTIGPQNIQIVTNIPVAPKPHPLAIVQTVDNLSSGEQDDDVMNSDTEVDTSGDATTTTITVGNNNLSRSSTNSQLETAGPVSPDPDVRVHRDPATTPLQIPVYPQRLSNLLEKRNWAERPVPQGPPIYCYVTRRKEGVDKLYPQYDFYIEEPGGGLPTFIMSARKRKKSSSSCYIISTLPLDDEKSVIGKVRSNFIGTSFVIYDNGNGHSKASSDPAELRQELGVVHYEPNILGFKGPRKMSVILPGMKKDGQRVEIRPNNDKDTLIERSLRGDREILTLHNKQPQWNDDTQSFVLNFNGRVSMASVKNFQIVHDDDMEYIIMQFGRVAPDRFTIDFRYPMSPLQAFAIALTSFDAKLACE
ncbi:hypothetical protein HK098_002578 [Nowakowskiella sp. JEL0407]|nr:hypothetical protein HK098_002578 [Nowakowskiella sp. JEL0407]